MIAYLKGTVLGKDMTSLTIGVGGVGYAVHVPNILLSDAADGAEVEVYTYLSIASRDETMVLYGFSSREELGFFRQLIKISGVGPKSALGILSAAPLVDLVNAIAAGDSSLLRSVSGIGKKTAERVVVELRDKLGGSDVGGVVSAGNAEVYDALAGLGYSAADIRTALQSVPKMAESVEDKIREALKILGG